MTRIAIRSRLSPEQARDVVRELIRPEGFLGGLSYAPNDRRPYIGRSKANHFRFRRRIVWHNSFQPVIVGTVRAIPHGVVFEALIRPHLGVALLAPVLFGMLGFDAVSELHEFVQTSGARGGYGLLAFLLFFGGFAIASHRFEVRMAERILREAFERKGGVLPDAQTP
jgi:hypothetical protein